MLARGVIAAGLILSLTGIGVLAVNDFLGLEIRQALIAGLVVASAWLVTFLVQDWNREVERRSRQTDIRAMSANRRSAAYGHFIEMTIECEYRARDALTQLGYSLGTYDDQGLLTAAAARQAALDTARKSLRSWISKTDPDRSGRSTDEAL